MEAARPGRSDVAAAWLSVAIATRETAPETARVAVDEFGRAAEKLAHDPRRHQRPA